MSHYNYDNQVFRDFESIGAVADAVPLIGKAVALLVVDRHKLRGSDKAPKNVRNRWQVVSCDPQQRYCRLFRGLKAAKDHLDGVIWRRLSRKNWQPK